MLNIKERQAALTWSCDEVKSEPWCCFDSSFRVYLSHMCSCCGDPCRKKKNNDQHCNAPKPTTEQAETRGSLTNCSCMFDATHLWHLFLVPVIDFPLKRSDVADVFLTTRCQHQPVPSPVTQHTGDEDDTLPGYPHAYFFYKNQFYMSMCVNMPNILVRIL